MGSKYTNLFLDSETAYTPDSNGDYHLITDYERDFNYWNEKIANVIKGLSSTPSESYLIIYGGKITDSGGGQVDISEGMAIGKNSDGDVRIVTVPALTNVPMPSGWDNGRQIWCVGRHTWKSTATTRTHKSASVSYHPEVEDSYEGETSSDDLFVDSDPGATVVCWGSFTMTSTTFASLDSGERSQDFTPSSYEANFDEINEKTSANGVTIDGVKCKDELIYTGTGAWVTSTLYKVGQKRIYGCTEYYCKTEHTSGTFVTDWITNGYWVPLGPPPGTIRKSGAYDCEANEFICDGTSKSRTTYAVLYSRITKSKGAFTVNSATPAVFTLNGHGLLDGHCVELTTTGGLYTGILVNIGYYVEKIDDNTFYLHEALSTALAHTSGSRIATSGSQSGTHSLRFIPWGIPTGGTASTHFLLPNFQAVVPKGAGTQTINTRLKTAPPFGGVEEDQMQGHIHNIRGYTGSDTNQLTEASGSSAEAYHNVSAPITDGTNGAPRTGSQTRENSVGVNFFIKYE